MLSQFSRVLGVLLFFLLMVWWCYVLIGFSFYLSLIFLIFYLLWGIFFCREKCWRVCCRCFFSPYFSILSNILGSGSKLQFLCPGIYSVYNPNLQRRKDDTQFRRKCRDFPDRSTFGHGVVPTLSSIMLITLWANPVNYLKEQHVTLIF